MPDKDKDGGDDDPIGTDREWRYQEQRDTPDYPHEPAELPEPEPERKDDE